ncbi:MAG TPA: hypothetical protein VE224_14445, partial [Pseudolabrys sp.]|nr:hypothetical protein [Pseudolabrys sp.]
NTFFVPSTNQCGKWSAKNKAEYIAGQFYLGGAFPSLTGPNTGWFSAIDVDSGVFNWRHHLGLPANGGALVMDNKDGKSLVFTGLLDGHFNAYDGKSGKLLWSHDTGASFAAPPATFTMDGARYVVVASGDPGFLKVPGIKHHVDHGVLTAFRVGGSQSHASAK